MKDNTIWIEANFIIDDSKDISGGELLHLLANQKNIPITDNQEKHEKTIGKIKGFKLINDILKFLIYFEDRTYLRIIEKCEYKLAMILRTEVNPNTEEKVHTIDRAYPIPEPCKAKEVVRNIKEKKTNKNITIITIIFNSPIYGIDDFENKVIEILNKQKL